MNTEMWIHNFIIITSIWTIINIIVISITVIRYINNTNYFKQTKKSLFALNKQIEKDNSSLKLKKIRLLEEDKLLNIRENAIIKHSEILSFQRSHFAIQKHELEQRITEHKILENKFTKQRLALANMSSDEAKTLILAETKKQIINEVTKIQRTALDDYAKEKDNKIQNIIITSIEKVSRDMLNQRNATSTREIVLTGDITKQKGRLIGREGRNIKLIQNLSGVNIDFAGTNESIVRISSLDPLRRELAAITIANLLSLQAIQPKKVEETWNKVEKEKDNLLLKLANKAIKEVGLSTKTFSPNILKHLGKLAIRTSYGQNVLDHCVEVAQIASNIANELGIDSTIVRRAAFLHDIGKAIDYTDSQGSHIIDGTKLALQAKESNKIINAIESHHDESLSKSIEAVIVRTADMLSAGRAGARKSNKEILINRLSQLENTIKNKTEVDIVYVLQTGREIRVIVKPDKISDENLIIFSQELEEYIRPIVASIPGEIRLTIIRERRINTIVKKINAFS